MKVIGLCGGSGSGKGETSRIFSELGFAVIDTDLVYRELTSGNSECTEALRREFGDEVISPSGALDRRALAALVFRGDGADARRLRLNEIAHRYILAETRRRLSLYKADGYPCSVVDAPVLFESGFDKECDVIVSVVADKNIRLSRITARDNISLEAAEERIASQLKDEEIISRSDFVIRNNGDFSELSRQVVEVAEKILK